jgi:hypothetical protein
VDTCVIAKNRLLGQESNGGGNSVTDQATKGCQTEGSQTEGGQMEGCQMEGCQMEGCQMEGCQMEGCQTEVKGHNFQKRKEFILLYCCVNNITISQDKDYLMWKE